MAYTVQALCQFSVCTARHVHDCFADFVAKNLSVDVSVPSVPGYTTLMSVFGWIIIHQNVDSNFNWYRLWADYKAGFGSIDADFWLGLEKMHLLTSSQAYRLRVEVQEETTGDWYSAEYWTFTIGDETNEWYRIHVDGYSGDAGDRMRVCQQTRWSMNGMNFTTRDRDNDNYAAGNCARFSVGAWWFNSCNCVCLTCRNIFHGWSPVLGASLNVGRSCQVPV